MLTLSGINTNTVNINQKTTDATVINESVEAAGDTDYEEDDEVNDETDDDISDEEESMSIEEKYERNKRNYTDDSGDTLVWYDVPYCDNHDFEVLGDETETMYICKKCGYSYSEFHENTEEDDDTDSDEDENGSDEEQESDDEDTCNE